MSTSSRILRYCPTRRPSPGRPVARIVDQGERELDGVARGDLRRAEGDELGGLASDDVDGDHRRDPCASAIGIAVESEADLGSDLRITIDLRSRRAGTVDELDLLSLAADQVGVAIENEFLRSRLSDKSTT